MNGSTSIVAVRVGPIYKREREGVLNKGISKCKVMYFGKNSPHKEYYIQRTDAGAVLYV